MKFNIEISTDSTDKNIKDRCLEAVQKVLELDKIYFGIGYSITEDYGKEKKE